MDFFVSGDSLRSTSTFWNEQSLLFYWFCVVPVYTVIVCAYELDQTELSERSSTNLVHVVCAG